MQNNNSLIDESTPLEFYLSQNYPNPFKEKTTIKYCVAYKSRVRLTVFDHYGNMVEELVNDEKQPGTYSVEFRATTNQSGESRKLDQGYYSYQMQAGDFKSEIKWLCINNLSGRLNMKQLLQTLFFFLIVTQICYSQVNWTKYGEVLSGEWGWSAWNNHILTPCVIFNGEYNRFEMWFSAWGAGSFFAGSRTIGFAYSNDGVSWTMHPDPVLEPSEGTWDSLAVSDPFVIRENGQYKMWYSSRTWDIRMIKIGYATSTDGINWTKYTANPIFEAGTNSYETGSVYGSCVMPVAEGYKMWYTVYDTSTTHSTICYATSLDGILWLKDTLNNPVLEYGEPGEWDEKGIFFPRVLFLNNLYYMWYGGYAFSYMKLGLATSPDGIHWSKSYSNPVLSDDQGDIQSGSVMLVDDTLHMWYDEVPDPPCGGKVFFHIYLANSYFESTSVDIQNAQPTNYVMLQNYPNPFNPSTKIKYSIPQTSQVQIKVFDVLGNEIETLVNEEKQAGTYELNWNATDLPSGVYFYQLRAGYPSTGSGQVYVETKKMLLIK